jgi:hypothetical protein
MLRPLRMSSLSDHLENSSVAVFWRAQAAWWPVRKNGSLTELACRGTAPLDIKNFISGMAFRPLDTANLSIRAMFKSKYRLLLKLPPLALDTTALPSMMKCHDGSCTQPYSDYLGYLSSRVFVEVMRREQVLSLLTYQYSTILM